MNTRDIITVIRDPNHVLGKQFSFTEETGKVEKRSTVAVSMGIAVQRYAPDVAALGALLAEVSDDPHAAIINSCFPKIEVGRPFLILSEDKFSKRGIQRGDISIKWPVSIDYEGSQWPALGRFKEHTSPSAWQILDRDIDKHTPPHYAALDYEDWLQEVDKLLPGILKCARLRAHSSSARVIINGIPLGSGNGHTWFQVADPDDIERFRSIINSRAVELGMAWAKPKFSRTTGEEIGKGIASIIDPAVFLTGRLVFTGKPGVQV